MSDVIEVVLDVECYKNYFMVGVRNIANDKTVYFERYEGHPLDAERLARILRRCRVYTFNGTSYDIPMVSLALTGATNAALKQASDMIVTRDLKPWQFEQALGVTLPKIDHIDLIEVAPGQASLKIYGGRVHTRRMQDLPIDPDALIEEDQRQIIISYNANDLNATIDLKKAIDKQLELRAKMSEQYGVDLRSKSDAQIAEAVITKQIEQLTGVRPKRPEVPKGTTFKYLAPDFIRYETDTLREVLRMVVEADFVVTETGGVKMPKELDDAKVEIGNSVYRMGIGGLHSSESASVHVASEDHLLIDRDVASYYPSIILGLGLYPQHLGTAFLKVYKSLVDRRLAAKRAGDRVTADSLKITINGSFGKLGSKWSALYSPDLMIRVTVTGQLSLLMLIERLELAGISVVSANTDGVVIKCPKALESRMDEIVSDWESRTGFETEATRYAALYSRDVNNYIALKQGDDGKIIGAKTKGAYAATGLQKNPANLICVDAVVEYLTKGSDIGETIRSCRDVRKFVTVRTVQGGAVKGDEYLGKAIRWVYGMGETGTINYAKNGNKVPRSDGAVPLMELPDEFPDFIDYGWYIREAYGILRDIGHPKFQWDAKSDHLI